MVLRPSKLGRYGLRDDQGRASSAPTVYGPDSPSDFGLRTSDSGPRLVTDCPVQVLASRRDLRMDVRRDLLIGLRGLRRMPGVARGPGGHAQVRVGAGDACGIGP